MNVSKKIMLSLLVSCVFVGSASAAEENPNQQLFEAAMEGNIPSVFQALQNGADNAAVCNRIIKRLRNIIYLGTEPGSELDIIKHNLRRVHTVLASGEGPSQR